MLEKRASIVSFNRQLVKLAAKYENIVVLAGDCAEKCHVNKFEEVFGDRFFNFGRGDQNLIGVAAGMALMGKVPFVFLPANRYVGCLDQIRGLLCYSNANVKLISAFAGIGVGRGGGLKQCFEDVALMRALPRMKVAVPMDALEAEVLCEELTNDYGPTYVRLSENEYVWDKDAKATFQFGESFVIRGGRDVVVFAMGDMCMELLQVAERLDHKHDIAMSLVNISSVKPIDEDLIVQQASKARKIFVVEEHGVIGGLGSAVKEVIAMHGLPRPVYTIAMDERFGLSGSREQLREAYGFNVDEMVKRIQAVAN